MSRRGSEAVARLVDSDSSDVQFGSFRKLAHFINNFNFFYNIWYSHTSN